MSAITEHLWYTKSSEWTHEEKWRFTRLIRKARRTVTTPDGDDIPRHEFQPEAVCQVILGLRVSDLFEGEIKALLLDPSYLHLTALRAELMRTRSS